MTDPTDRRIAGRRNHEAVRRVRDGVIQYAKGDGYWDIERRYPYSDRRRACHCELGDSCDVCTPELAAPTPAQPSGAWQHSVSEDFRNAFYVRADHKYSGVQVHSWLLEWESSHLTSAAEGRMPSCHTCGTVMDGVCPKCGASTAPSRLDTSQLASSEHAESLTQAQVQPAGAREQAHRFALRVQAYISACRGTDRMTGALADLNRDAEGVLKSLAAASVPVQPVTAEQAREWRTERCHLEVLSRVGTTMFAISAEQLDGLLAAFANRTSPAREGK